MFNLFEKIKNFVKNSWLKFKNFISSIFKNKKAESKVSEKTAEKVNAEIVETEEETQIVVEAEVEEIKEEVNIEENEAAEETIEDDDKDVLKILVNAENEEIEEINFALLAVSEDEEQSSKFYSALNSKSKAEGFARNFVLSNGKLLGRQLPKSKVNQVTKSIREGNFLSNEEYRNTLAELLKNGFMKLALNK